MKELKLGKVVGADVAPDGTLIIPEAAVKRAFEALIRANLEEEGFRLTRISIYRKEDKGGSIHKESIAQPDSKDSA